MLSSAIGGALKAASAQRQQLAPEQWAGQEGIILVQLTLLWVLARRRKVYCLERCALDRAFGMRGTTNTFNRNGARSLFVL